MSQSRRLWMMGVLFYLAFDYCDPVLPGVFFFDTESLVIQSVDAKPETPVTVPPAGISAASLRPPMRQPRIRPRARRPLRAARHPHSPRARVRPDPPPSAGGDSEAH